MAFYHEHSLTPLDLYLHSEIFNDTLKAYSCWRTQPTDQPTDQPTSSVNATAIQTTFYFLHPSDIHYILALGKFTQIMEISVLKIVFKIYHVNSFIEREIRLGGKRIGFMLFVISV